MHAGHLQRSSRRFEVRGVSHGTRDGDRAGSRRTQDLARADHARRRSRSTCWAPAGWATIRGRRSSIATIGRTTCRICSSATAAAWSRRRAASRPRPSRRWRSGRASRSRRSPGGVRSSGGSPQCPSSSRSGPPHTPREDRNAHTYPYRPSPYRAELSPDSILTSLACHLITFLDQYDTVLRTILDGPCSATSPLSVVGCTHLWRGHEHEDQRT